MSPRRRTEPPQLQMAIMVDVLFILLVFFILVSEIRQADVDVELPRLEGQREEARGAPQQRLRVAVDSGGKLYLDGQPQADLDALRAALDAARAGQQKPAVSLRADREARSGETIRVIHLLSEMGFERVHFDALAGEGGEQ